jgi:cytochrome bd ubiquinol oxidase subunit I
MNTPQGFTLGPDGALQSVDLFAAMWNPAAIPEILHMTLAAYATIGFAVAGIHAFLLLRHPGDRFHRRALGLALAVGGVFACLQPLSGDLAAKHVAEYQPVKLAAMEGHWDTKPCAGLSLGGLPNETTETTPYALEIPCGLSFLAFGDPQAEVKGLKDFPIDQRPPVAITHIAFQIMVACGMAMMAVAALGAYLKLRGRDLAAPWFLRLLVLSAPLGLIALEAGWTVTEVGRQPWVIQGLMRTADAVTPMPHLIVPFTTFTLLYVVLGVTVVLLLTRKVFTAPEES